MDVRLGDFCMISLFIRGRRVRLIRLGWGLSIFLRGGIGGRGGCRRNLMSKSGGKVYVIWVRRWGVYEMSGVWFLEKSNRNSYSS